MNASTRAQAGVQPRTPDVKNTGATGRLEKLHRLRSKGFEQLYKEHQPKWKEMVENAKKYAKTFIGKSEKVIFFRGEHARNWRRVLKLLGNEAVLGRNFFDD